MTEENQTEDAYEGWAILELMGHRRLAGRISSATIAGTTFLRVDIENRAGEHLATQFYSGASIYCLTPSTEDVCRAMGDKIKPRPVQRYELDIPEPPRDLPNTPNTCLLYTSPSPRDS